MSRFFRLARELVHFLGVRRLQQLLPPQRAFVLLADAGGDVLPRAFQRALDGRDLRHHLPHLGVARGVGDAQ